MPFDDKKQYKEFYAHKNIPSIIEILPMNFISVRGKGNPSAEKWRIPKFHRTALCH